MAYLLFINPFLENHTFNVQHLYHFFYFTLMSHLPLAICLILFVSFEVNF
jgi:hypothetical protein